MKLLTKEQHKSDKNEKSVVFVKKNLKINIWKVKNIITLGDHYHYAEEYRRAAHIVSNLKYGAPKKIPIVFRNGSNYDYHFIIKEIVEEFKTEFTCLAENTKKYITFKISIEKRSYKNW